MLGSMIACALLGIVIERLAYRPVRREAAADAAHHRDRRVALPRERWRSSCSGADPKFFPSLAPRADFIVAGVRLTSEQITVIVVSFLLMLLLRFFIMKTRIGKAMRAVSFSLDAATLMGIIDRLGHLVHLRARLGAGRGGGHAHRHADPARSIR